VGIEVARLGGGTIKLKGIRDLTAEKCFGI
jgi:hypothetical protein